MTPQVYQRVQKHMATDFDFQVSCPDHREAHVLDALQLAHWHVGQLERELSEFIEESPINQLNQSAVGEKVRLSTAGMDLLLRCRRISKATGGCFEPTVKGGGTLHENFGWDAKNQVAWKKRPEAHLGFGAIGKGYALDKARLVLEQYGFGDYLLSAGGSSLFISGFRGPETPWEWGWAIQKEKDVYSGFEFVHQSGIPVALGISGTMEQGDHLIEPGSGVALSTTVSSLIAHPSATEADALSTAFLVGGWERSIESFAELETPPAMALAQKTGETQWNGIFEELWGAPR